MLIVCGLAGKVDRVSAERDTVIVVSNGIAPGELDGVGLPAAGYVIAADGGAATALELGLRVDELIGDLDSVSAQVQARVAGAGARVRRFPVAKDATDLELALAAAVSLEPAPRRVIVLGGAGGRLDHLLAGALLLAAPQWAGVDATHTQVEAWLGRAKVTVVRDRAELAPFAPGALVTLLAVGGVARGVTTSGLRYPLDGHDLVPGTTLGVSNEFTSAMATVSVTGGVLLAVQPAPVVDGEFG
jgi:thiamine pyrophosphokinase